MRFAKLAQRINPTHLTLAVIMLVGLILAHADWRVSYSEIIDLTPQIRAAYALLTRGIIPYRGTLTSFASFTPPGTTWLRCRAWPSSRTCASSRC